MANRVVLGKRNNGDYGLFISPPGVDATTASDGDLAFSTTWTQAASIHAEGLISLDSNPGWVSFPALPYTPHVIAGWYDSNSGYYYYSQNEVFGTGGSWGGQTFNFIGPKVEATNSQIRVNQWTNKGTGWYIKYYILRMPGGV